MHAVPLIGFAEAGSGSYFDDGGFPVGKGWEEIAFPQVTDEHAYALEISGNSMKPAYRKGDVIVVSPAAPVRKGDRVVVKTKDGEMMVKELKRQTAKSIELKSLNTEHRDRTLSMHDVLWVARIVWASQLESSAVRSRASGNPEPRIENPRQELGLRLRGDERRLGYARSSSPGKIAAWQRARFMTNMTIDHPNACTCCGDMLRARFDRRRFLHLTAGAGLIAAFPTLAFGAEGNYDAMLLTCIDPRFPEPTIKYRDRERSDRPEPPG